MKRLAHPVFLAASLLLPMGMAVAQPASSPVSAVTAPISALDAGLIQAMKAGGNKTFAQRYEMLAPVVKQAFDLRAVLRLAVGLRWSQIPADQQDQLLVAFTRFTVASYVANFNAYNNDRIDITGTRAQGADQVVQTTLIPADGKDSHRIDYVMRHEDDGQWRAVDVLLDGTISRAAVTRSDFRSLLTGGNAQKLIQHLEKKYTELAAGNQS